jgi:hypothetical protein
MLGYTRTPLAFPSLELLNNSLLLFSLLWHAARTCLAQSCAFRASGPPPSNRMSEEHNSGNAAAKTTDTPANSEMSKLDIQI